MIDMQELIRRDDVKVIAFHHMALDTIKEMARHNERVADTYGEDSPEFNKQVRSFYRVMTSVLNAGFGNQSYVTAEGKPEEKSLFVQEGGNDGSRNYVFGVIFFRDRSKEGAEVQPGDWSVHS
jgi:hypothetical protein